MMVKQFSRSCAVLLPYARDIYALRGSAAMMEAVCWGRPIITLSGTAFAEQVSWYRLGVVVNSPSDMAAEVLRLAQEHEKNLNVTCSVVAPGFLPTLSAPIRSG